MRRIGRGFWADLRYGGRLLVRNPGFAAAAVSSLALGIGANTALFSVTDALMLRTLPVPHPEAIVRLRTPLSYPAFRTIRDRTQTLAGMCAFSVFPASVRIGEDAEQAVGQMVSGDFYSVLGVKAVLGRLLSLDDDQIPGVGGRDGPVGVISYQYWQRRFALDPSVVGRTITLNGVPVVIVGVAPPQFFGVIQTLSPDLTLPVALQPRVFPNTSTELWAHGDEGSFLSCDITDTYGPPIVARLKPGVGIAQAQAELTVLYQQVLASRGRTKTEEQRRRESADQKVDLTPAGNGAGMFEPQQRALLLIVMSAVPAVVLLIACANVATLLLARGERRRREIATRAAMGAQRSRVIRQLLTESGLLTLCGGVLGLAAGVAGLRAIVRAGAEAIPSLARQGAAIALDPNVVWFTVAVSLATGVLFGVLPALTTSRVDLSSAFKDAGTPADGGWRRHKTQSALVVLEMTLAIVLLVGCGLMVRTLVALRDVDRGFDPRRVIAFDTSLSGTALQRTDAVAATVRNARQRLAAVPGIVAFAAARALPLEPAFALPFTIDRRPASAPFEGNVDWRGVSPGYFDVFRIPVLRGRAFEEHDDRNGQPVVIVNAALARRYWQSNDPVGETLTIGTGAGPAFREGPRRIIGVVADPRDEEANRDPVPMVYVPLAQVSDAMTARNNRLFPLTWVVRTEIEPRFLKTAIERELRDAAGLPIARTRTMEEVFAGPARRAGFHVTLMSAFAAVALLLAVVGFYGLMSYSVQQRTQEIGIRMALGAVPADVRTMILLQGLKLAATGVVLGTGAALVLTRVMVSLVFGVKTYDPAVFGGVALLLSVVALLAALVPAHRATRINPLDAVRGS
jgi:putative ABC transport system permease protein